MKKHMLVLALAIASLVGSISVANSVEAARPSLGKQIRRDVDRIYRNQVRSTARNRAYREIRKILKYTDPDSREFRELRAKRALLGLPLGASIVQCDPNMQSIMSRLINRDPDLTLFEYKVAKSRNGKRLGLLVVRYSSIDEMME